MMTKRDFELVAACLRNAPQGATAEEDRRSVAEAIALEFELDNPRFDSAPFLRACGMEI